MGRAKEKEGYKFSTFKGVFTPNILTILGVILFLRFGFVVGSAGLAETMIILILAHVVSIGTTLSMSAIATNLEVKGGGDYFLISRSMGREMGGAVGIVLYFAQAISVALYVIGFTEALFNAFPLDAYLFTPIALAVCVIIFIIVYRGADFTIQGGCDSHV